MGGNYAWMCTYYQTCTAQQAYTWDWVAHFYRKVCCISMHNASLHAAQGLSHAVCTLIWDCVPHIHTYRHTLVGLHICPGIGMLMYVVYKHMLTGFTPTNMLVYMLTDTCSALCVYMRMRHSSLPALQIYTWRVYTNVQGSGMLKYTYTMYIHKR